MNKKMKFWTGKFVGVLLMLVGGLGVPICALGGLWNLSQWNILLGLFQLFCALCNAYNVYNGYCIFRGDLRAQD